MQELKNIGTVLSKMESDFCRILMLLLISDQYIHSD